MQSRVNLFVVGAAKAGTTWLYNQFAIHPNICVPIKKELNFFTRFQNNPSYYSKYFRKEKKHVFLADISPLYFHEQPVARRIYEYNQDAKIIIMLREPLDRAYSHYYMRWLDRRTSSQIEQEFKNDRRYVGQGLYYTNIKQYLDCFPKEQVHICYFDDLKADGSALLNDMYDFLGLESVLDDEKIKDQINYRYGKSRNASFHKLFKWANETVFKNQSALKKLLRPVSRKLFFKSKSDLSMPKLTSIYEKEVAQKFISELEQLKTIVSDQHIENYIQKLKTRTE